MPIDIPFPAPIPDEGSEGERGPTGQAYTLVTPELVAAAFRATSSKKSPGPDKLDRWPLGAYTTGNQTALWR